VRNVRQDSLAHFRICVRADKRSYESGWWKHPGFWAIFRYRFRRLRKWGPVWCRLLLPFDIMLSFMSFFGPRCEIPTRTRIGPGLFLPHPDGVILSEKSKIGSYVSVFQQVTLGCWRNSYPQLRSRSAVFAGAKVIGGAVIGRGACVGANAVVTKDVPARHVATGIPAKNRPLQADSPVPVYSEPAADLNIEMPADPIAFPGKKEMRERVAM
jgi:serine O-acetyltransferase